jgi:hypothetical protein
VLSVLLELLGFDIATVATPRRHRRLVHVHHVSLSAFQQTSLSQYSDKLRSECSSSREKNGGPHAFEQTKRATYHYPKEYEIISRILYEFPNPTPNCNTPHGNFRPIIGPKMQATGTTLPFSCGIQASEVEGTEFLMHKITAACERLVYVDCISSFSCKPRVVPCVCGDDTNVGVGRCVVRLTVSISTPVGVSSGTEPHADLMSGLAMARSDVLCEK